MGLRENLYETDIAGIMSQHWFEKKPKIYIRIVLGNPMSPPKSHNSSEWVTKY